MQNSPPLAPGVGKAKSAADELAPSTRGSAQLLSSSPDALRRSFLLLLPLPPSVCPLDDLAPFSTLGCKLSPSPLLLEGGPTRKGRVSCLGVWIIEFIIQLNEELFERMAEGHAGPSNDAG